MSRRRPRRLPLFAAAAFGLSAPTPGAHASSLVALLDQVPAPPADVATALAWLQQGQIVAPEYTHLKQAIEAERAAIAALNGGAAPAADAPPVVSATEAPEVQIALKGYSDYLAATAGKQAPAATLGKRARWLHAAMAGKLGAVLKTMKPCPLPCTDEAALAQNQPTAPARRQLAEQDLRQWNTLFLDWQSKRRSVVGQAQAQIDATGEGAKAGSPAARSSLASYRAAMLREVEVTLSVTELALKRLNAIEAGDVDAVSGSTYSPKKKS